MADATADPEQARAVLGRERFAICSADFYGELADKLAAEASATFVEAGVPAEGIDEHRVPGAFELPLAARWCAESGRYAGVACLGTVIRGETDHYDFVCSQAAEGLQRVSLDTGVPCAFGVITCETMDQALARAGGAKRSQGRDAAEAVMRMMLLGRRLH
ncbi:MAG: 6,7-dimethyl-8-ribityllumazine synthase [Solirubrobacterales bacterium]